MGKFVSKDEVKNKVQHFGFKTDCPILYGRPSCFTLIFSVHSFCHFAMNLHG